MGPERIELSTKKRERLKVLHEVEQGHLKQVEAARPFNNAFLGTCKMVVMSLPMNREIARAKLGATKPCTWANQFGGNMPRKSARVPG